MPISYAVEPPLIELETTEKYTYTDLTGSQAGNLGASPLDISNAEFRSYGSRLACRLSRSDTLQNRELGPVGLNLPTYP